MSLDLYTCTCGCPDGPGQHLCGCHSYDTPVMTRLREEFATANESVSRHIRRLGNARPTEVGFREEQLRYAIQDLAKVAAKVAVEDAKNPDGSHSDTPWN